MSLIRKDELTYDERMELEMTYDGPIPPQAIADKIRMRLPREEELRGKIAAYAAAAADHLYVADIYKARRQDGLVDMETRKARHALDMQTECERELEQLEPAALKLAAE